jgi:hypothetical protein
MPRRRTIADMRSDIEAQISWFNEPTIELPESPLIERLPVIDRDGFNQPGTLSESRQDRIHGIVLFSARFNTR